MVVRLQPKRRLQSALIRRPESQVSHQQLEGPFLNEGLHEGTPDSDVFFSMPQANHDPLCEFTPTFRMAFLQHVAERKLNGLKLFMLLELWGSRFE